MRVHTAVILLLFMNSDWKMAIHGIKGDRTRELFASRTPSDWRNVWHGERHRRCYSDLVGHMEWACNNDIYKETKRFPISTGHAKLSKEISTEEDKSQEPSNTENIIPSNNNFEELENFLLSPEEAMSMLNSRVSYLNRKRKKRGIMDECCTDNGCSWEEYAEYCPTNRRIRT